MKIKLDYYRIFYEIARYESFSAAAKQLFISQSAISQCIHQLETDLNTTLFVRTRRGVTLTGEGKILFSKIESAMQFIEQGETMLERLHRLESGELAIAASDTITSHYLLPYLEQFHAEFPSIRIEMANSYSQQMIQLVKEGKSELAFVNMPLSDEELCIEPIFEVHDIFVCGPKHNKKESYTWKDISREPLILLEENSSSRHYLDRQFLDKGIALKPQIEIAAHDLMIRFASINLGVSCVTEEFSKDSLEKGLISKMNLDPPLPARSIGCAYMKDNPLSLASQTFLKFIKQNNYSQNSL